MIQAMIFDLDGTLAQTEKLKALSCAQAAVHMCPYTLQENEVIEAFKDVAGLSRREVAAALMDRFNLTANTSSCWMVQVGWMIPPIPAKFGTDSVDLTAC